VQAATGGPEFRLHPRGRLAQVAPPPMKLSRCFIADRALLMHVNLAFLLRFVEIGNQQ
jgi:hypothetical protein